MQKNSYPLIPIIGYSACISVQEANKCYECGMDLYLPKPVPFEELKKEIANIICKRDYEIL